MWSEKRSVEDFVFFATVPILINVITNLIYFFNGKPYSMLEIINEFNGFTTFGVAMSCIFNIFIKPKELSENERDIINKKMLSMKLLGIVFIGYMLFSIFVLKNTSISISSLIMFVSYVNWYILKFKSKAIAEFELSETQKKWREFNNIPTYQDSNLIWKIKPMISPHVSVRFIERIKHINWPILIFIIILFKAFTSFKSEAFPIIIIIFILIISDILYLIDVMLGLYSKTEGICTGVVKKERDGSGKKRIYYEIYVTDAINKRELKFKVYKHCNYNEGDNIEVIHGGLSKKVIKVEPDNFCNLFRDYL